MPLFCFMHVAISYRAFFVCMEVWLLCLFVLEQEVEQEMRFCSVRKLMLKYKDWGPGYGSHACLASHLASS